MSLPASFAKAGFGPLTKPKFKRLMVGTDGPTGSGKSEFALSAPGYGIAICLDRGIEAMLDNQSPPTSRNPNFAIKVIDAPLAGGATKETYEKYWVDYRDMVYAACNLAESRSIFLDGDSDSWELQRLGAFGKLTQIPSIMYTGVNTGRRLFYSRLYDSGKIVIASNKVKKHYKTKLLPNGDPEMGDNGKPMREWDGKSFERQGFEDQDYLWQVQLRHYYDASRKLGQRYGVKLMKVKADPKLEGMELWGSDCCFEGVVQTIYPHVPLSEWGF